jgi:hypothetical protein
MAHGSQLEYSVAPASCCGENCAPACLTRFSSAWPVQSRAIDRILGLKQHPAIGSHQQRAKRMVAMIARAIAKYTDARFNSPAAQFVA